MGTAGTVVWIKIKNLLIIISICIFTWYNCWMGKIIEGGQSFASNKKTPVNRNFIFICLLFLCKWMDVMHMEQFVYFNVRFKNSFSFFEVNKYFLFLRMKEVIPRINTIFHWFSFFRSYFGFAFVFCLRNAYLDLWWLILKVIVDLSAILFFVFV